jgi:hypothetical protein
VHRSYELRPLRIVSKGASDVADEDVEAGRVHMAVGPEGREELIFIYYLRSVRQQSGQQVERLPGQVNLGVAAKKATRL